MKAQNPRLLSLDEVINELCLESPATKIISLEHKNEILKFDNYKREFLPSISLSFSPFNFNRSINLLQNPVDGTYRYVEDYLGSTSMGLRLTQKIGVTGGNLTINTNQNIVNEFSNSRRTFSSIPFSISYSQNLFGGSKKYKYEKSLNYKENTVSKLNYCLEILKIQQRASSYYISAYTSMLEEEIALNNFKQSDSLLNIAKIKLTDGNITWHDFNLAKIKNAESKYHLEGAKIKHKNSIVKLLIYLGLPANAPQNYQLSNISFSLPINLIKENIYSIVMKNNPFKISQEIKKLKIEAELFNRKSGNAVNPSVTIGYGSNQFSDNLVDSYKNPNSRQSVSIAMLIPIFKWGINKNILKIAENEYQKNLIELINEEIEFNNQIDEKISDYNSAIHLHSLAKMKYDIYKNHYGLVRKTFLLNKASIYDLYAIKKEQQNAMQNYIDAINNVWDKYFEIRTISLYDFIENKELIPVLITNTKIHNVNRS